MMHMSFCLANLGHWSGINPTSPSLMFDVVHLGGRYISFKARRLFRPGMFLPNFTPNLIISLFHIWSKLGTSSRGPSLVSRPMVHHFMIRKVFLSFMQTL
jgi:hypothetical protein